MATTTRNTQMISGLFPDAESADRAYQATLARGYTRDEISLLMNDNTREQYHEMGRTEDVEESSKALEGAGTGGGIGTVAGGILGAIAAIGTSLVIPGAGLIIAGPLAAGLAGAGAGGLTGGLVGALVGAGIPEDNASDYETRIHEGGVVLTVAPHTVEEGDALEREWKSTCNAIRVDR